MALPPGWGLSRLRAASLPSWAWVPRSPAPTNDSVASARMNTGTSSVVCTARNPGRGQQMAEQNPQRSSPDRPGSFCVLPAPFQRRSTARTPRAGTATPPGPAPPSSSRRPVAVLKTSGIDARRTRRRRSPAGRARSRRRASADSSTASADESGDARRSARRAAARTAAATTETPSDSRAPQRARARRCRGRAHRRRAGSQRRRGSVRRTSVPAAEPARAARGCERSSAEPVFEPIDQPQRIDERPMPSPVVVDDVRQHRRREAEIGKLPPGIVRRDRRGGEPSRMR